MKGMILSLCDFSGNWSRPYEEAGYQVFKVDIQTGHDVLTLEYQPFPIHGILAAPPCTEFARSGAMHWEAKGEAKLLEALAVVDACLRAVAVYRPTWWCLENPIGRLKNYLGEPKFKFDPCDFGDPWTKRTWLWGHFTPPTPLLCVSAVSVEPTMGDVTTRKSGRDKNGRSATSKGFARAFFEANP